MTTDMEAPWYGADLSVEIFLLEPEKGVKNIRGIL
jgi:hypothetical protein